MFKKLLGIFVAGIYLSIGCANADVVKAPSAYLKWLDNLKDEMQERGISKATIDEAFAKNYYHPRHKVIKKDRHQTEFVLTTSQYLHRVVAPLRVSQGRKKYQQLKRKYPAQVKKVPLPYLISFWGIETNFGTNKGGFSAIEALTLLSYDKRRSEFFKEELYNALKIIDEGHISVAKMESSWAGALGHFQFMPSTLRKYGIDADNDGKINVWNDFNDALYSAANYLSEIGWNPDEPWGKAVSLKWNFDYSLTGRHHTKTVSAWKKAGVEVSGINDEWKGSVIVPEGHRGQAYLVFDNFKIIMHWNKSENYALAVGLLADKIQNKKLSQNIGITYGYKLTKQDVKKIQSFINRQKIAEVDIDGVLGGKTRQAIQKTQKLFKMPADGYPDYRLLENIDNYSRYGYYPPVPIKKLHRGK